MIKKYFQNQIDEISVDPALRVYGFFVSMLIVVTSVHWIVYKLQNWLVPGMEAICWPMFEHCKSARVLDSLGLQISFYVMGVFGLFTAYLFLKARWVKYAWLLLILLNIVKHAIILLDYRMRLNQHIMVFFVTVAFLFIPHKKKSIKILIIMFYFWAGLIKLDPQWLSGTALYIKPWFITDALSPWACTYVVVLEVLMIWSLFWSKSWMAWLTFAQLVVFHIFSFKVVGFYYPLIMFGIISLFPITWYLEPKKLSLMSELRASKKIPYTVITITLVFLFFQVLPKTFPGDNSVTGEGRLMSLHMFDALNTCNAHATLHFTKRTRRKKLYLPLAGRIRCDPAVYLSRARNICHKHRKNRRFKDVDLFLETKKIKESNYSPVIDIKDFCHKNIQYSLFRTNRWILKK